MPDFASAVAERTPILTDGGIETRVMFETGYAMDPDVQVAQMVGDPEGEPILRSIYGGYVNAAKEHGLPVVIGTPTFRASENFARRADLEDEAVERLNLDAVAMHRSIRAEKGYEPVFIAGVLGPSGDAYLPGQGSNAAAAANYHRRQATALAGAGADFLFAATFPAVDEALGVCRAMAATGLPYVISFVLGESGDVLDGTGLADAIARIDAEVSPAPTMFSISCVHPTVAARAVARLRMSRLRTGADGLFSRLGELKANGSPLPTAELIKLDHPEADPPEQFAEEMAELFDPEGLHVLGGCCGTTDDHMRALAARLAGLITGGRPGPLPSHIC